MSAKDRLLATIGEAAFVGADKFAAQLQTEIATPPDGVKANVISGAGATRTLLAAEAGSKVIFDRAAGTIFTLPAPVAGMKFEFMVSASVTSNAHKIITDAGTTLLIGSLFNIDTDSSNAVAAWTANGTTHISISMNGTTTGGLIGTKITVEATDTTHWMVSGIDQGSLVVATPFATS